MDGAAAMLWLWRAHNNVTSRLLAEQRAARFENPFKCRVHTRARACVDDLCLQLAPSETAGASHILATCPS
eukprot:COSAG01_NODE_8562_length_2741_cov_3.400076_1_plen_71_part_00